jgi:cell division GTPase FtsZ
MEAKPGNKGTKSEHPGMIAETAEITEPVEADGNQGGSNPCPQDSDGQPSVADFTFTDPDSNDKVSDCTIDEWLPALDLEQYEPAVESESGVQDHTRGSIRYAWIGTGQCGGRLVKSFYDLGYKKVLAVNTTQRDLKLLDIPDAQKFLMYVGEECTGRDMERGAKAIRKYKQDILHLVRQTFGTQIEHIMISFGAGGGTGSGSVFGLIEVAKRYARYIGLENPDRKVGVIMTLPAAGRVGSPLVAENAYKIAAELSQMAAEGKISPLIIVDNNRINKMSPRMTTELFWSSINSFVANLFDTFNRISVLGSQYISFDTVKYHSIIEAGGFAIMCLAEVDEFDNEYAISKAVKNSVEQAVLAGEFDLTTAKAAACIVVGGKKIMANAKSLQHNIDYAFDVLAETTGQATIYRGIYEDNNDSLRVYTIVGGLGIPDIRLEELGHGFYFPQDIEDVEDPPLRERKEDIVSLTEYFLAREAFRSGSEKVLSPDAKKLLLNYSWPGNARELAGAIRRACELTSGREIQIDTLPYNIIFADSEPYPEEILPVVEEVRRRIIIKLFTTYLNPSEQFVAGMLGIECNHLNCLIEKLGIADAVSEAKARLTRPYSRSIYHNKIRRVLHHLFPSWF